ncbi:dockerin type I repeat protein [Pelomyxa schiedti]|nr:dockerin type I repeat protein [Pelomyxa schiedti]
MVTTGPVDLKVYYWDAESLFAAFGCASIDRCGSRSAARLLCHNPVLREQFGRDWVVGCCKQFGATLFLRTDDQGAPTCDLEFVHVFIGVSAVMGVVWCTWWSYDFDDSLSLNIQGCVGDDRFLSLSWELLCITDSNKNVVATLDGKYSVSIPEFWVTNSKWIVKVEPEGNRLVVWQMDDGEPLSFHGLGVTCGDLPMKVDGGGFSPFDPSSDELVLVGDSRDEKQDGFIWFVDLVRSTGNGVIVMGKESVRLQHSNPVDLAWSSPNTILTVHEDDLDHIVFNTTTGESANFDFGRYDDVYAIPPGLHFAALLQEDPGQTSSVCEVYSASNMGRPLCRYEFSPVQHLRLTSSSKQVCVVQKVAGATQQTTTTTTSAGATQSQTESRGPAPPAFVLDAITGTQLIEVRVSHQTDQGECSTKASKAALQICLRQFRPLTIMRAASYSVIVVCCCVLWSVVVVDTTGASTGDDEYDWPTCWVKPDDTPGYLPPYTRASRWSGRTVLAYADYRTIQGDPQFTWSPERFQMLLGFCDRSGVTVDRFFDSVLLIAYVWKDGKYFYEGQGLPMNQTDWLEYLELQFDAGVANMEIAQANVKQALQTQLNTGVVFMIPYPDRAQGDWGYINGKHINFTESNDDRMAATQWWVDQVIAKWNSAPPSNLNFVGFYWFVEHVDSNEDEKDVVSSTGKYIHTLNPNFSYQWIPHWGSEGMDWLADYGFDVVTFQPNYAFNDCTLDRFGDVVEQAVSQHMGIEIEAPLYTTNPNNPDWQYNMMAYLNASSAYHFNSEAMLTFYYGNDFTNMATQYYDYYEKLYWLVRGSYPNPPTY